MTGDRWGKQHKDYLFSCFSREVLDPVRTDKTDCSYIVDEICKPEHQLLHPFVAKPIGQQTNNNKILGHYRKAASEFIANQGLAGSRRKRELDSDEEDSDEDSVDCQDDADSDSESVKHNEMKAITKKTAGRIPVSKKKAVAETASVKEVGRLMDEVSIAEGRIPGVPLHGLIKENGLTMLYWSWQWNAKWFVDFEIFHKVDNDDQFKASISRDGKYFNFEVKIPERLLLPGSNYTLKESFGSSLPTEHPRSQKKVELLNALMEQNGRSFDSEGLKNCISVPLPFICKRAFHDSHADPENEATAYAEQYIRTVRKITEYDYVIRACCVASAEPILETDRKAKGPNIRCQGHLVSVSEVLDDEDVPDGMNEG